MSEHALGLCGTLEELVMIYEEILGRSVAKKWAIVRMDTARLDRLVQEEEVLATECRAVEQRRLAATTEFVHSIKQTSSPTRMPTLSEIVRHVSMPSIRERLARAAHRLRGVLAMLRRVVDANRQLIAGGLRHFEHFYRVIREASMPRTQTYSPRGAVMVRDPGQVERALRFVDRQV